MSESGPDPSSPGKKLNVLDRAKQEFEAFFNHKETHGLRDDINVNTSINDVKAPNVFERAKEEIEAAIHPNNKPQTHDSHLYGQKRDSAANDHSAHSEKAPNLIEKALKSLGHKPHHHKETHGTSDDIDENTPISEVRGPNVFERAKEEIEALIQTIHPKNKD